MNRKIVVLTAIVMALALFCAQAAPYSPQTVKLIAVSGFELDGLVIDLKLPTETAQKVFQTLTSESVLTDDVLSQIAEGGLLPESADANALHMDEYDTLYVSGYEDDMGDVMVSFKFATDYRTDDVLVMMIGKIVEGDNGALTVEWTALTAKAQEDGSVSVVFPQEMLKAIQAGENEYVFALLKA